MRKQLIKESGIRDINDIAKRYNKAKIYFHIDLDGLTSAIAMKTYLESYGIDVVDAETIQYGQDEFSIKKPDASGNVMPVLVDFAHGKPMFKIHTDHHDSQAGVESGTSTSFRHARSNVETISGVISTYDLFPPSDIKIISTVDSANFRAMNISVREVMNFIFKVDTESVERSGVIMGLVTNKIVLAFKNKNIDNQNILEKLVLVCTPSLKNIYNNMIRMIMNSNLMDKVKDFLKHELGDEEPKGDKIRRIQQQLQKHGDKFVEKVRGNIGSDKIKYEDGIIIKDGAAGASMIEVGSYDRYVAFELIPEADFQVITWGSVGLLQVSCNPFKESRGLKGVDLGKMNKEIINNHKSELESIIVSALDLKKVAESSKNFVPGESVGFTLNDLIALYGVKDKKTGKLNDIVGFTSVPANFQNYANKNVTKKQTDLGFWQNLVRKIMLEPYVSLNDFQKNVLRQIKLTAYDVILKNSGGHKCITNFQASALGWTVGDMKTTEYIKMIRDEFIEKLKNEIEKEKKEKIDENYFKNIIKKVLR
jgi:hypothetical protein